MKSVRIAKGPPLNGDRGFKTRKPKPPSNTTVTDMDNVLPCGCIDVCRSFCDGNYYDRR